MANLYEIQKELLECVDMETGEIIDIEKLGALELEKSTKIENIALFIKNLKADKEAYKKEKQLFAEKEKAADKKIESLTGYLEGFLEGEKFKSTRVTISYRKSTGVVIDDITRLYEDCLKSAEPVADKTYIKAVLKSGIEVPGAHLEEKQSIQIK